MTDINPEFEDIEAQGDAQNDAKTESADSGRSRWITAALATAVTALWLLVYATAASEFPERKGLAPLIAVLAFVVTGLAGLAFVSLSRLLSALAEQRLQVAELASHDPLSGAFNHGAFIEILDREFARSRRYGQPLSLLIFDVDFFKRIHDGYGSLVGSSALQSFAKVLQSGLRNVDAVGRLGSEEFAVMLPNTPAAQAVALADRLREDAAAIVVRTSEGDEVRFTTSVGVAEISTEDVGVEDLVRRTDSALCQAKDLGRNRVELSAG